MEASDFDRDEQGTEPATSESSPEATPPEASSPSEPEAPAEPEPAAESGPLAGTSSEQEPGVGGTGDHPAPATMRGEDGEQHSAGQPPSGTGEHEQSPTGDSTDQTDAGHALDPEAKEELEEVHEPDQVETERPDLGTE